MKVLISAYACSPDKGSEPGTGWGFVKGLAATHHELFVITEQGYERAITRDRDADASQNLERVRFYYVHRHRNHCAERVWPPAYYWTYRRWHLDAYRLAIQLHKHIRFDLAHQLTMSGFREPGYLWKLDIPFVWGPMGGMGFYPWRFLFATGGYGAIYYLGYNLLNWLQMNFLQRARKAAKAACSGATIGLIATTRENQRGTKKYWGCCSHVLTEVGLPFDPLTSICQRSADEPLRIVWSGLHIPRKALNLALLALKSLPSELNWELHILGEGHRTKAWKILTNDMKIDALCRFYGWIPREKALDVMLTAHLMLITSLRDQTPTVTAEALSLGLPIICLDHCGFSDAIDETCGIKIPVTTPQRVVSDLAGAIAKLARDEHQRRLLANGALIRARHFAWQDKVQFVNRIYRGKSEVGG